MRPLRYVIFTLFLLLSIPGSWAQEPEYTVHLIPNTHGTIAGWLVNFDTERSHILNNYLDHLERMKVDSTYSLAISEVPNVMALLKFAPEKIGRVLEWTEEGRVEFVNGFFLEPTVNLSGGEALAQMATLGQKWYEDVLGVEPRFAWMIDVCGIHEQMPQVVAESGLEALFFYRNNPMPKDLFWWYSPDGSKTLAVALGSSYSAGRNLFNSEDPLSAEELASLAQVFEEGHEHSVSPRHVLMAAGGGDYSLAPRRASYPAEFLRAWEQRYPGISLQMSTPGRFVDAVREEIREGKIELDDYRGSAAYSYNAFWMNMPRVKRDYRRAEHLLQAAETVSTWASLRESVSYPAQAFYNSWIQMMINMDRNVLWGAGSGSPFYDSHHWNAWDRFDSVLEQANQTLERGLQSLSTGGESLTLFNPLNWERGDPVRLTMAPDRHLEGVPCEARPGTDDVVCFLEQPSTGVISFSLSEGSAAAQAEEEFRPSIETDFYQARFDPENGALVSLRDRETGKEYLSGPANVIQAESVEGVVKDPANWMAPRPMRKLADSTSNRRAAFQLFQGPLSVTVVVRSGFAGGSRVERRVTFYHHYPRIDFETTLDLRTTNLVVTADFPLAGAVVERTHGIPFGFSAEDPQNVKPPNPYFLMSDHKTYGFSAAIQPAVRWSDYTLQEGGGVALLDRGLSGHELNGNLVTLALVNAQDTYRGLENRLLTGKGVRTLEYALWPHTGNWREEEIPRRAWEYNAPLTYEVGRRVSAPESILSTSDNVIVQVVRRVEGEIEVRLAEWSGREGEAFVTLRLPHQEARMTNLKGERATPLEGEEGTYRFAVRPQQIVTLRFTTDSAVSRPRAIREWGPLVPWFKRGPLEKTEPVKGYPEITHQPTPEDFGMKSEEE